VTQTGRVTLQRRGHRGLRRRGMRPAEEEEEEEEEGTG